MSQYGVLNKTSNIICHIFDDTEKAKRYIELEAINDFTERVECLQNLLIDHERTLRLRDEHTKTAKKKLVKKPVQKPAKKSKKNPQRKKNLKMKKTRFLNMKMRKTYQSQIMQYPRMM